MSNEQCKEPYVLLGADLTNHVSFGGGISGSQEGGGGGGGGEQTYVDEAFSHTGRKKGRMHETIVGCIKK